MKQFIVVNQMEKELSKEARIRPIVWAAKHKNWHLTNTTFSIGQMIEFLDEQYWWDSEKRKITKVNNGSKEEWTINWADIDWTKILGRDKLHKELCDALWEAVKETLEYPYLMIYYSKIPKKGAS